MRRALELASAGRFAVGQDVQEDARPRQRRGGAGRLAVGHLGLAEAREGDAGGVGVVGDRRPVVGFGGDRHHVVERAAEDPPRPDPRDAFDVGLLPHDHPVAGRADRDLGRVGLRRRAHADRGVAVDRAEVRPAPAVEVRDADALGDVARSQQRDPHFVGVDHPVDDVGLAGRADREVGAGAGPFFDVAVDDDRLAEVFGAGAELGAEQLVDRLAGGGAGRERRGPHDDQLTAVAAPMRGQLAANCSSVSTRIGASQCPST